jgi:hypothetical protein
MSCKPKLSNATKSTKAVKAISLALSITLAARTLNSSVSCGWEHKGLFS